MTRWTPSFEPVLPPSALWGSLVKSGYQVVYALEVEGIPFIFAEREMWTTRGLAAGYHNLDDLTISYALSIDEGDRYDQACNREEGLAAGRAVDFTIGRQQLADEALGPLLFARPTLRSTLTLAVTDPDMDTFEVDSTTGWDAAGLMYIGRECVRYTSLTATSFGGCVRGVAGMPHYHTASTASAYRQCTDTPVYWRGRLVTLWEHLVSPEGRFLGERWAELGLWCRQAWRGTVRDTPRPEQAGMVLTCLPLPRVAAQEFGAEISGKMRPDWIVSQTADTLTVQSSAMGTGTAPTSPLTDEAGATTATIVRLSQWCATVSGQLTTALSTDTITVSVRPSGNGIDVKGLTLAGSGGVWLVKPNAWFLEPGVYPTNTEAPGVAGSCIIPFVWSSHNADGGVESGAWIVVELDPNADAADAEVGDGGMLALEVDGETEIASYDLTKAYYDGRYLAFRLNARGLISTPRLNLWGGGGTSVRAISAAQGGWMQCLRILLTSSGMGSITSEGPRGINDTLPYGFGLGLPDEWIAISPSMGHEMAGGASIVAASTERTSVQDLLCGWLALTRHCLVQRRQADGSMQLDVISTDVIDDPEAETLTETDVLLDGHETPEMIESPNHVRIGSGGYNSAGINHIVRDAARAQAEGVRSISLKAPGITGDLALQYGAELMLLGDGQAAVRKRLPPWVEIDIGDTREDTSAHPAVWDWSAGTYAPTSVLGRVVELGRSMYDQTQDAVFLLAGHAQERIYYCPSALVTQAVSTTVYRVEAGGAVGFAVSDEVLFYERGNEDVDTGTATITAIVEGTDYDTITVDADPAVDGAEIVITFDVYANAVTRQRRHMFAQTDKAWR